MLWKGEVFEGGLRLMQCCDIEYTEDKLLNTYVLPFPKLDISRFTCDFGQKYAQVDEANHLIILPPPHFTYTPSSISVCVIVLTSFYPLFFCPLLFQAIIESPNNQLTLSDIYAWFQSTFGHFRQHNATWKVTRNLPHN